MKILGLLALVFSVAAAKSATVLTQSELTEELIKNPRYLVWETQEGLYEVEDLETEQDANITLFATEDDITFHIYTPEAPNNGVAIKESQLKNIVKLTGFKISRPTLVIIHGWRNNHEAPVNDHIKNAVLINNKINVIVVDWSPIAERSYVTAQGSVVAVGNYVGDFLLRLDSELKHKLKKITIIGHSLGAHIAGNAGARTNGLIETIIGLDAAGPLFSERNTNNRLDPTDGKYVHVIHTNDGLLGFRVDMGHTDYYPNGGSSQPGCGLDLVGSCAHSRAYIYFAESLTNNNFLAKLCDTYRNFSSGKCDLNNTSHMGGYPIQTATPGEYYLTTNNRSPFAQGL